MSLSLPSARYWACLALLLLLGAALFSAVEVVQPGEVVVARRFGAVESRPWGPGMHVSLPFGLVRRDRVRPSEVRTLTLGALPPAGAPPAEPGSSEMLTSDFNMVTIQADVQYRVADPAAFVLTSGDREGLLARTAAASLAEAAAGVPIDEVLKTGRADVARTAQDTLSALAARLGMGVEIVSVAIRDVHPPAEVADDFRDVQTAESQREQRRYEARRRVSEFAAVTRSKAREVIDTARGRASQAVGRARGDAERFLALLPAVESDGPLVRLQLFGDAMRRLLPGLRRKLIVNTDEVDLSVIGTE
jgi:membrane protease subunit HflK